VDLRLFQNRPPLFSVLSATSPIPYPRKPLFLLPSLFFPSGFQF
jgi:hypothetical protein